MGILDVPGITQGWLTGALNNAASALRVLLDSIFDRKYGTRGIKRTIYVRAAGNDTTGDGKTPATAYRYLRTAVNAYFNEVGPLVRGTVEFNVDASVQAGGIDFGKFRGIASDDLIRIVGPTVTDVPTVLISKNEDPTQTYGLRGFDGMHLMLQNIKFVGGFDLACDIRRWTRLAPRKLHFDGQGLGLVGLGIMQDSNYDPIDMVVEGYTQVGVQEHFGVTRSYDGATSYAQGVTIKNCATGLLAKETPKGHLDYLTVQDCGNGIELHACGAANLKLSRYYRNLAAIVYANTEIHNTQSVEFGTGADANVKCFVPVQFGVDLSTIGWEGGTFAQTSKAGRGPLTSIVCDPEDHVVTGVTSETAFANFASVLKRHHYTTAGTRFIVKGVGKVGGAALLAPYRLCLKIGGTFAIDITLPTGTAANTRFHWEFEMLCKADGNNQMFTSKSVGVGTSNYRLMTAGGSPAGINMSVDVGVNVYAIPGNSADSVTLHKIEVWG